MSILFLLVCFLVFLAFGHRDYQYQFDFVNKSVLYVYALGAACGGLIAYFDERKRNRRNSMSQRPNGTPVKFPPSNPR